MVAFIGLYQITLLNDNIGGNALTSAFKKDPIVLSRAYCDYFIDM